MTGTGYEHDTVEWRAVRDRLLIEWIGDPHAVRWVLDYFDVCELFDDLIDQDKLIERDRVHQALWESLYDMPGNPFFQRHASRLLPIIHMGINCWLDANRFEVTGERLHLSYVMRAAYTWVIQEVVAITRGRDYLRDISIDIVRFFSEESFEEYVRKLGDTPCPEEAAEAEAAAAEVPHQ